MILLQMMMVAIVKLYRKTLVNIMISLMLLLQVMMVAKFKINKDNFLNIKRSLMLLLQMMMVTIFKLTNNINDFQDIIDVTLTSDDSCHVQAHK